MVSSSDALAVDLTLPNKEKLTALKLIYKQDKNASELVGSMGLRKANEVIFDLSLE